MKIKLLLLLSLALLASCTLESPTEFIYVEVEGEELRLDPNVVGKWEAPEAYNGVGDYTMLYFGYDGSYAMEYYRSNNGGGISVRVGTWTITSSGLLRVDYAYGSNYEGATNSQYYEVSNDAQTLYIGGEEYSRRFWQQ